MSEMINKKITDSHYDQSLAVKCINGTFVGKKSERVITYKGIPFVDSRRPALESTGGIYAERRHL